MSKVRAQARRERLPHLGLCAHAVQQPHGVRLQQLLPVHRSGLPPGLRRRDATPDRAAVPGWRAALVPHRLLQRPQPRARLPRRRPHARRHRRLRHLRRQAECRRALLRVVFVYYGLFCGECDCVQLDSIDTELDAGEAHLCGYDGKSAGVAGKYLESVFLWAGG